MSIKKKKDIFYYKEIINKNDKKSHQARLAKLEIRRSFES